MYTVPVSAGLSSSTSRNSHHLHREEQKRMEGDSKDSSNIARSNPSARRAWLRSDREVKRAKASSLLSFKCYHPSPQRLVMLEELSFSIHSIAISGIYMMTAHLYSLP
jgi:hypothetical protein